MGFPAARVGDIYAAHGDMIPMGSPNVKVNSRPFHRAGDIFICPIIGVGITIMGSGTVKVNSRAAARVTSMGQCLTPNAIAMGSSNVNVGG